MGWVVGNTTSYSGRRREATNRNTQYHVSRNRHSRSNATSPEAVTISVETRSRLYTSPPAAHHRKVDERTGHECNHDSHARESRLHLLVPDKVCGSG